MTYPLSPTPAQLRVVSWPGHRCGVHYVGDTVTATLNSALANDTTWTVRDYFGNVVSSGAASSSATSIPVTAPGGGWAPGWYRLYLNGTTDDATFGTSAGASSFCVIRDDAHFPVMPADHPTDGRTAWRDVITKGVMGLGTSRLIIADAAHPHSDPDGDTIESVLADLPFAQQYWSDPGAPYADSQRPRPLWGTFRDGSVDHVPLARAGDGAVTGNIYRATTAITGSGPYIKLENGSTTGKKLTVRTPTAADGDVVETYDNITDFAATAAVINTTSTRIRVFAPADTFTNFSATAIGRTRHDGVVEVVQAFYPDVQHFEGPVNEPRMSAEVAHMMRLYAFSVHAGHPDAVAMGPVPVALAVDGWAEFLAAGGATYCDALAFHDYNSMTNGCLPLGRNHIERWIHLLEQYGADDLERWQTEAGAAFTSVYGVHHPRRARVWILHTLLWEQYGVTRERNSYWYDVSHGFWDFPTWFENDDHSLTPEAVLARVLAAETWGRPYTGRLSFGEFGDRIFLGNVYTATNGDQTLALVATSSMPDASITLTVTGATDLTMVDAFGNEASVDVADHRATFPVAEVPTYVRVPAGVNATVHHCNDWPTLVSAWSTASPAAIGSVDGAAAAALGDNEWPFDYGGGEGVAVAAAPISGSSKAVLHWKDAPASGDRLLIWAAYGWQPFSTLVDFDVDVSDDGTTWETVATVTKDTPTSFLHGTDYHNVGCKRETYWDEQWVFDVKLDAPVTTSYLRLNVRATSYGGEPDAAANTAGGQGQGDQVLSLMEVAFLSDANTERRVVLANENTGTEPVPPEPFDPNTVASLVSWLRADDLALSDGDQVTLWEDAKGANDAHAGPGIGNPPLYDSDVANGHPGVVFTTDDTMEIPNSLTSSKPWSFAALFSVDDTSADHSLIRTPAGPGANVRIINGAGTVDLVMPGVAQIGVTSATVTPSELTVVVVTYSGTGAWTIRIDDVTASGTNNQTWAPGAQAFLGFNFAGVIREALFFKAALSADERDGVAAYLAEQGA